MDKVSTVETHGHAHGHAHDHAHEELGFWRKYVFSQDHKVIGIQYAITALLFLLLWFFSPLVAYWLSRPAVLRQQTLAPEERAFLRRQARRTWRYFESFVGERDNWLPPDNYQELPDSRVAHRTSPTRDAGGDCLDSALKITKCSETTQGTASAAPDEEHP